MLEQLHQSINEVLSDGGRPPIGSLTREMTLRGGVGLDSLELAVLTVKLEAETGVDVFADGLVTTVGEVEDRLLGR